MLAPAARRAPLWRTLIALELRLFWRELGAGLFGHLGKKIPGNKLGRVRLAFNIGAILVIMHGAGFAALALPRQWEETPAMRCGALLALVLLATWLVSAAMTRIVSAFYERRDVDFLLAAPVGAGLLLAVRVVAVVISVWALFAFFVYPFLNVGVALGRFWLVRYYLLMPLLAMLATAIGLFVTGAVIRLLGVRRARVALQVFAALSGAAIYFASQASSFLSDRTRGTLFIWFQRQMSESDASVVAEAAIGVMRGDRLAWLALTALSCAGADARDSRDARPLSRQCADARGRGARAGACA